MNILLWVLQIFAALLYGASGVMKVIMFDKVVGLSVGDHLLANLGTERQAHADVELSVNQGIKGGIAGIHSQGPRSFSLLRNGRGVGAMLNAWIWNRAMALSGSWLYYAEPMDLNRAIAVSNRVIAGGYRNKLQPRKKKANSRTILEPRANQLVRHEGEKAAGF